ncbi:MAG: ATP-grasp domain-containing protein [Planctomycetota bacterium]|nr:ATP-grasp domain-containing protein [Planctomycetota bacterium]
MKSIPTLDTLLVLSAGRQQIPLLQTGKRLGLRVVAIDPCADALGRHLADAFYENDLGDLKACRAIATRESARGVLTAAADFPVSTVAHLCTTLGLPGLSEVAAICSTNKHHMRRRLNEMGVPCPRSLSARTYFEVIAALAEIDGAAILKPTVCSGGRGVTRLPARPSSDQVRTAYESAIQNTRSDGILVEEFIDGPEFSIETLTFNGHTEIVAVTDKLTTGDPYFVEIGHSQPACVGDGDRRLLIDAARTGIAALGIDWAASHVEIRLGREGPRIMEIGARLGGGCITSHLVPLSSGVDMLRATIQLAMGQAPDLRRGSLRGAAIRFFAPKPGRVWHIAGVEEARRMPGVCDLEIYIPSGDVVPALRDSSCRVGHVVCEGADAYEAIHRAEAAARRVQIFTESPIVSAVGA